MYVYKVVVLLDADSADEASHLVGQALSEWEEQHQTDSKIIHIETEEIKP